MQQEHAYASTLWLVSPAGLACPAMTQSRAQAVIPLPIDPLFARPARRALAKRHMGARFLPLPTASAAALNFLEGSRLQLHDARA